MVLGEGRGTCLSGNDCHSPEEDAAALEPSLHTAVVAVAGVTWH